MDLGIDGQKFRDADAVSRKTPLQLPSNIYSSKDISATVVDWQGTGMQVRASNTCHVAFKVFQAVETGSPQHATRGDSRLKRKMYLEMDGNAFTREQLDVYFASFVGMEGGNPAGAVWFCDHMPTTDSSPLVAPLMPKLACQSWDAGFRAAHAREMTRWQTHQRIARIMTAAREMVLFGRDDSGDWQRYLAEYLYRPLGWEFKLSLFPLPIRVDSGLAWKRRHGAQPELNSRIKYLALCRDGGRFRFIEALRRRERPKVVVCLGERHEADYVHAFGMRELPYTEHTLKPADQARVLRIYQDKGTRLVICPAVAGAAGLTSDVLLNAMGRYISQWLTIADFQVRPDESDRPLQLMKETDTVE